jgi:deoxyribose-phosphate aldolase
MAGALGTTGERPLLNKTDLARRIDHTLLKPNATASDVDRVCDEAIRFDFWSVCVGPYYAKRVSQRLENSEVKTCVVVGFPFGFAEPESKLDEATLAIEHGADEIDVVMNISAFKSGDYATVDKELESLARLCREKNRLLKVILECCYLTDEEKILAARMAERAGADFVKTSTGFGTGGATVEDVRLLRESLSGRVRIKASGGIGTAEKAIQMIGAGADRIGTSSGVKIMSEWDDSLAG